MKVREIRTGNVLEVNGSYGARLIEQGKAVLIPSPPKAPHPQSTSPAAGKKGKRV